MKSISNRRRRLLKAETDEQAAEEVRRLGESVVWVYEDGTGYERDRRKVRCVETSEVFGSLQDAAESAGVTKSAISSAISRMGCAGGFHWEYCTRL